MRGYIKNLQTLTFDSDFDNLITGNLIHNRVNLRWNPVDKITAALELRNRLFWGEEVRFTPEFTSGIRNNNDVADLSVTTIDKESMVLFSNIDRLWVEYQRTAWNLRVGRQRINWGIGTTWNPNDIFNTFNFLDFDYEERPGRDAVKSQYHISDMSMVELAVAFSDQSRETVGAIRYFTNVSNYDLQFLAGWFRDQFTAGGGWSGIIGDAGFKGELQYYFPNGDYASQLNLVVEGDYVFEKGWYLNLGFLANSRGISGPVEDWSLAEFQFSPQHLMPTKWNTLFTVGKEFTPLLSGNVATIFAPQTNLMILLPSLKYNISTNLDVDLTWQSFFAEEANQFRGISHRCFLRFKWNF